MATFKLDDVEIPFEPGDTIIRAAHRAGVDIPHYCWHPGLSVAANCRMCLVEMLPPPGRPALLLDVVHWDADKQEYVPQKKPKLVPACQQSCAPGMEIRSSTSDHVEKARSAVQELLLLNHPVDCPICDQAGECRLQDYWLEHQHDQKRMRDEPVHKPKAVPFGPTIVYDAERCIICTRCVRFSDEVAKDPVLEVRERGNLNEITVAPGRRLDHGYTLMTEHVCPVGALTSSDFRFKARVWFLRSVRSVCQGCATGCNAWLDYDPRDQTVHRHRPRDNEAVNKYWMCDEGMLDYRRAHDGRVEGARVAGEDTDLHEALGAAAQRLRGVKAEKLAVVLSAGHSNEDNFALLKLGRDYLGSGNVFLAARPDGEADSVLKHTDKNPNRAGATALCTSAPPADFSALVAGIGAGLISHVLLLGSSLPPEAGQLGKATVIALATHEVSALSRAAVVLPVATWAESTGTFVNAQGMAQESEKAISPQGDAVPGWKLIAALGRELGFPLAWTKLNQVRAAMAPEAGAVTAPSEQVGASP